MRLPLNFLAALGALALTVSACTDDPTTRVFVGEVGNGDVLAAALWRGDDVIVYTCGEGATLDTSTVWIRGTAVDDTLTATSGDLDVVATRDGDSVLGTFTRDQTTENLTLAEAGGADVGIFQDISGSCRTAAIATRRGGTMVIQGAHFCDSGAPFYQVTPVRPPAMLGDTLTVQFDDGSGSRELVLRRVDEI